MLKWWNFEALCNSRRRSFFDYCSSFSVRWSLTSIIGKFFDDRSREFSSNFLRKWSSKATCWGLSMWKVRKKAERRTNRRSQWTSRHRCSCLFVFTFLLWIDDKNETKKGFFVSRSLNTRRSFFKSTDGKTISSIVSSSLDWFFLEKFRSNSSESERHQHG